MNALYFTALIVVWDLMTAKEKEKPVQYADQKVKM